MMEIVGLKKCASTTYVKILAVCMELVDITLFAKPLITREYVHVHLDTVEIHIHYVPEVSLQIFFPEFPAVSSFSFHFFKLSKMVIHYIKI